MLLDVHGKKHSLSDYTGKPVVLEFVNVTCPYPEDNYKAGVVQKLQKQYAAKGVVWLSVIITGDQQDQYGTNAISLRQADSMARAMTEQYGASPAATLIDRHGTAGAAYGTRTSEHLFVVDPQGVLVYDGALDSPAARDRAWMESTRQVPPPYVNYVAAALDATLAGKSVATAVTMPYGCHQVWDADSSSSGTAAATRPGQ